MNNTIKTIRNLLVAAFVLASSGSSWGQGHSVLHLDKSFYVNGEIAWYKLYLPSQFEQRERIVQVTVLDDRGAIQEQHYLKTNGATSVNGYYKVPFDCPTAVYQFVFSGIRKELGGNILLASAEVPIYNDFDMVTADMVSPATQMPKAVSLSEGLSVEVSQVEVGGQNASTRARVTVRDANGRPVQGHISVSVTDAQLAARPYVVRGPDLAYGVVEEQLENTIYAKGIIRDADRNPLQVNVLGAFSSTDNRVQYSKSSTSGAFSLAMDDFTGSKQVQFVEFQQEVDALWAELSQEVPAQLSTKQVEYTPDVLDYLALSRKRKKIFQYFTMLEQTLEPASEEVDVQELKPDFSYKIAEYEDFDFMRDFFGELITPLKFKLEDDSTYSASVDNPKGRNIQETHLSGRPLFVVDGKLTRNADFVARMDMGAIESVDLYYDPYNLRQLFNAIGRSGVVRIITRIPDGPFPEDDLGNVFTLAGLLEEASFPTSGAGNGLPNIRPLVYWSTDIATDAQGQAIVTFDQTDDVSNFRISVVAQAADGSRGYGESTYSAVVR